MQVRNSKFFLRILLTKSIGVAVTASLDGCLIFWNLFELKQLKKIMVDDFILNIDLTPMAKYCAIKTNTNKILIYETSYFDYFHTFKTLCSIEQEYLSNRSHIKVLTLVCQSF